MNRNLNPQAAEAPNAYLAAANEHLQEELVIAHAIAIIESRIHTGTIKLDSPKVATDYLRLRIGALEHECFAVLFLDVKNRLIACENLFRGTLTHTSVYPREVVKQALAHNAASVMLAHNHPSGSTDPSEADLLLTRNLTQALALVDVRVLDHFVVTTDSCHSMAEHGQL